jgi:hypothetical protein
MSRHIAVSALALAALLLAAPGCARAPARGPSPVEEATIEEANQVVYFDDQVAQTASEMPALRRLGPADLTRPVNYVEGRLYMRLEVIEKPSDLPIRPAYFIWQKDGVVKAGEKKSLNHMGVHKERMLGWDAEGKPLENGEFRTTGVYYYDLRNPASWWRGEYGTPDWDKPYDKHALVPWVLVGDKWMHLMSENCHSHCVDAAEVARHVPVAYRATGIWVAPGSRLAPPPDWRCPEEWGCVAATQGVNVSTR